ncbi:MAG: GNAT family N-acetyltransferase [Egibacteraceae bacterium]
MRAPEENETERLLLRRPQESDAPALFRAYGSDAGVTRFLTWRPKERPEEMAEFIGVTDNNWEAGTTFHWVLIPGTSTTCPPSGHNCWYQQECSGDEQN